MRPRPQRLNGASLVVALIMLALLSLVAATGVRIALTDEKGARAARERQLAFEGAEAALRDAEDEILHGARAARFALGDAAGFAVGCPAVDLPVSGERESSVRGLCLPAVDGERAVWRTADLSERGVPYGTFTGQRWPGPSAAPRYVIEILPDVVAGAAAGGPVRPQPANVLYRVSAEGVSASGLHVAAVQSAFRR